MIDVSTLQLMIEYGKTNMPNAAFYAEKALQGLQSAEARATELAAQLETAQAALDAAIQATYQLGATLRFTRVGWDNSVTCEGVLDPINDCAKKIGAALGID